MCSVASCDVAGDVRRALAVGKSLSRGHVIPDGLGTAKPFGVSNGVLEKNEQSQVKELVFPAGGQHSSTFQLNLSRFGHTSPCPPV